ncbi:MAG: RND transporter [Comamonadaceae bacterium]|nr:MAG: RND transporter [Comamonadaceae bacterium]
MTLRTHSVLILALAAAGFSGQGIAQMGHNHGSPAAMQVPAGTSMVMEEGTVKKIDKANGKVALAHSAQKDGMPAMTMVYGVRDPAWLDKMQVGQKVRFAVDPARGGTTVTQFELVK